MACTETAAESMLVSGVAVRELHPKLGAYAKQTSEMQTAGRTWSQKINNQSRDESVVVLRDGWLYDDEHIYKIFITSSIKNLTHKKDVLKNPPVGSCARHVRPKTNQARLKLTYSDLQYSEHWTTEQMRPNRTMDSGIPGAQVNASVKWCLFVCCSLTQRCNFKIYYIYNNTWLTFYYMGCEECSDVIGVATASWLAEEKWEDLRNYIWPSCYYSCRCASAGISKS